MLPATEQETDDVVQYMAWQAPDLTVEMVQKVYSENVLHVCHDVWDVHTNKDRWWVITEPTNLYSQEQFPNMDLALTFHIGLCLRVPRSERQKLSALPVEPFAEAYRYLDEASDALRHAQEVADYQAIGVRCREALLAFAAAAQTVLPWRSADEPPKKADMKGWTDHVCSVTMPGATHENRRHLFKTLLDSAWKFTNWLTHSKGSKWHDAEAGFSVTENAIGLATSAVIRHMRGVPDECPACGSHKLSPERGYRDDMPDVEWERPTCDKCGWTGDPVMIEEVPRAPEEPRDPPEGECTVATVPLRKLLRPAGSAES
jgi:hypothetical protein